MDNNKPENAISFIDMFVKMQNVLRESPELVELMNDQNIPAILCVGIETILHACKEIPPHPSEILMGITLITTAMEQDVDNEYLDLVDILEGLKND